MSMLSFDEDGARRIQRTYSTADVVRQRAEVLALLAAQPGERVLDVGSGPGFLVASLADAVGAGGAVHGVDPSAPMNALARELLGTRPWARIDDGNALDLPYPDGAFDAAVSTQVYEYVADIPRALSELRRVLRPGGRALVLDTDWDSVVWHSSNPQRMRRVLAAWNEHLADAHLPRRLNRLLTDAGFTVARCEVVPLLNSSYHPQTYSAGLIGFIAGFVPGRAGLTVDDVEAWRADLEALGLDYFCSVNRYLFLAIAA